MKMCTSYKYFQSLTVHKL